MFRFRKGKDPLQAEVWERNKVAMLKILREHELEDCTVDTLSKTLHLTPPAVRRHLADLVKADRVVGDYRERDRQSTGSDHYGRCPGI